MPEILRVDGFIVKIWLNDHPPRHVHIFKNDGECIIELSNKNIAPKLLKFHAIKRKDLAKALLIVAEHQDKLNAAWEKIHEN